MINDFIADVCEILKINTPTVSFDTSHFQTGTMLAQCLPQEKDIIRLLTQYTKYVDKHIYILCNMPIDV